MISAIGVLILKTAAAAALAQTPAVSTATQQAPISLQEALSMAESFSPELKAAQARELQAENQLVISRSYLLPNVQGQAGIGYGFLGGDNSLLGMEQLSISQEDHIGPIGGVFASLDVFNASAYFTIALAQRNLDYVKALTILARYQADLAAAQVYFEAARDLGDEEAWIKVGGQMRQLLTEVEGLIHSGYQNPVDALLVKDQVTQARLEQGVFDARYRADLVQLGALIGRDAKALYCPPAVSLPESSVDVFDQGTSPYLLIGQSQMGVAQANLSERKSENYPVLRAMGAVDGGEAATGYVPPDRDYALGLGVRVPLFEGFRITEQTKEAKNLLVQRKFDLDAAEVQIEAESAVFDKAIDSTRSELSGLASEYGDDERALSLARQRYRDFQGRLVDVREALRDLARVGVDQNDATAELLFSLTGKSLLNGGTVRH